MTARDTYNTSVVNAHNSAQVGGISFSTGATVAVPRNGTTWSRTSALAALANGDLTQSQFVAVSNAISTWEQAQINVARDTLKNSGDDAPA